MGMRVEGSCQVPAARFGMLQSTEVFRRVDGVGNLRVLRISEAIGHAKAPLTVCGEETTRFFRVTEPAVSHHRLMDLGRDLETARRVGRLFHNEGPIDRRKSSAASGEVIRGIGGREPRMWRP